MALSNTPVPAGASPPGGTASPRKRRQLAGHIAVLTCACALPLIGLIVYFLSTGLHREIAVASEERGGLAHMRMAISALDKAVRLTWNSTDPETVEELDRMIDELAEADPTSPLRMGRAPNAPAPEPPADMKELWNDVKSADPETPERQAALRRLVAQLHQGILKVSNENKIDTGPETEISSLTQVVVICLPLYVERVLHMHEVLAPTLRTGKWDPSTIKAASIFARQIEEQDIKRLRQHISAALEADSRSHHTLESFQQDFPPHATRLLDSLNRLGMAIRPLESGTMPAADSAIADGALEAAFIAAIEGWNTSIEQLDALIADRIEQAEKHRNRALYLVAGVFALFIPTSLLYFRSFIQPLVQTMIDDAATQKREAEIARAEADESTRRLRQTQQALYGHSAIAAVGPDHRILSVNERMCLLSGYPADDLIGLEFSTEAVPEPAEGNAEEFWKQAGRGEPWSGSLRHMAKDGRPVWANTTIFPFVDQAGEISEFIVIQTDITELVKTREAAEAALRAKSRFLAMVSHEIRTPMNGVIGFAQLLGDTELNEEQRDYARTIATSGEALLVVINDILDFSRLEAGRTELDPQTVDLRQLITDVLDLLSTEARRKNLELHHIIDPACPPNIVADGNRLRQILLNLAGNAVKFTASGHVGIRVRHNGTDGSGRHLLEIHVHDTGIGIPEDRQALLFEAFSQVDASISRNYGGTGLGLAISQKLAVLMEARIGITSTSGQGSDFHFTLPVAAAEAARSLSGPSATGESGSGTLLAESYPLKIAVVDDNAINIKVIRQILRTMGYEPTLFGDALSALHEMGHVRFDLILMDVQMPEIDGHEATRRIRAGMAGELNREVHIAALTAGALSEERDACLAAGMDSFLAKPISRTDLRETIIRAGVAFEAGG